MSKHFFFVLGLTILFVSMNLLSMHSHKIDNSLSYSMNNKNKEKKRKNVLYSSLSPTSYFKQKLIALHNDDVNPYSLIFSCSDQPCITQYLLDGKQVARLIQIGDEINFTSDDCKTHNFSLGNSCHANSLTITTQGQFIFKEKIDACSAYLTCKAIDFYNEFISENGFIIQADHCRNHSQLVSSDFLFKGNNFENMPKSSLIAHNSLTLLAKSLFCNKGKVDVWKDLFIRSSVFDNESTVSADNMRFKGNRVNNQGELIIRDTLSCESKEFAHSGFLTVLNDCIMKKGNHFCSTASSVLNIHGNWKAFIASMYLQGTLSVKDLYIVGKNFTSESPLHCIAENADLKLEEDMINMGVMKVLGSLNVDAENIRLEKTSDIIADNADLKVNKAIQNDGTVFVKNHLFAHARSISNGGKIEANSSAIRADRYYYNRILSIFSAKNNLAVNTPLFLNVLGFNNAQSLTINSGIGLNALGLYRAKNLNINALLSLNYGLLLPKFSSISEMCSRSNVLEFGKSLFIKYVPTYGVLYGALRNIQSNYYQVKTFCSEMSSLYKQKRVGVSDFIVVLCLAKNIFNSGKQTYSTVKQNHSFLSDISQAYEIPNAECLSNAASQVKNAVQQTASFVISNPENVAQQVVSEVVSHYGPQVNTCAAFDLNRGIVVGLNNHSSSIYNSNTRASFHFQNTINTYYGDNTSYLGAYNLNIKANESYVSGGSIGVFNGNIEADSLCTDGTVSSFNAVKLTGHRYISIADIKARRMDIKSSRNCYSRGKIDVLNGIIDAYRLNAHGTIKATNNIKLESKESVCIGATIDTKELAIKSDSIIEIYSNSNLTSENTYLRSQYISQKGSVAAEQSLVMDGHRISNSGTIETPKIIITHSEPLPPETRWSRCYFINEGELKASEQLFVDAANIDLLKMSHITTPNTYFKSNGYFKNDGNLHVEKGLIDAQNNAINNGSIKASEGLYVKAQNVYSQKASHLTVKDLYCDLGKDASFDGVTNIETGTVNAAGKVKTIGKMGASTKLTVNAKDIVFEKKAEVDIKKLSLTATETINNKSDTFSASELFAHAKYVTNSGTMLIDNGHIKADRYMWNTFLGRIEAKENLTIDALALFNTFGHISADSLCTNAIFDLNLLGAYSGHNIFRNSIIGVNAGILVPTYRGIELSALEMGWLMETGIRIGAQQFCPRIYALYSLVETLGFSLSKKKGLYARGKALYGQIQALRGKEDLCVSDVVPTLCNAKSFVMSTVQAGSQAYGLAQDLYTSAADTWQQVPDREEIYSKTVDGVSTLVTSSVARVKTLDCSCVNNTLKDIVQRMPDSSILPVFSEAGSFFGPQISNNSLFDVNIGAMLGVNGSSQSLYSANLGASLFANNCSVNTIAGINKGIMAGSYLSVNASRGYTSSGVLGAANLSMIANDLKIDGSTTYAYNNALLKARNHAEIDGKIRAHQVSIHAKNLHIKKDSHIAAHVTVVDAESIQGEKGSKITSCDGTHIKTNQLDNHGAIQGPTTLEFNGKADQLKSIGTIEQLTYRGTLENNIADRLADGHNALLDVKEGGAITIDAKEQNVHFEEQHNDMTHALHVQTEGAITCDQDLSSGKTIYLEAKGDIDHASIRSQETTALIAKNIFSEGNVTRQTNGESYTERCEQSNVSGNQVIIKSQEDVHYKATHVHSGTGGTQVDIGGKLISDVVEAQEIYKTQETSGKLHFNEKLTTTENHITRSASSTFSSDGQTHITAKNGVELHATVFESKGGTIINGRIEEVTTFDTHTQTKETKNVRTGKTIAFGQSETKTEKPCVFNDGEFSHIISDEPVSLCVASSAPTIIVEAPMVDIRTAKQETKTVYHRDETCAKIWESGEHLESHDITFSPSYSGTVVTGAETINIEQAKGNAPATINATNENVRVNYSLVEDIHEQNKKSYSRPTPAAMKVAGMVCSTGISSLAAPLGVGFKIALTGIHTFGWNAINNLVYCEGHYRDAAKNSVSPQAMKAVAAALLMSATTFGADKILDKIIPPTSQATTFGAQVVSAASREGVHGGIGFATDVALGKDAKEAVKQRGKEVLANLIGAVGSKQIGQAYGDGKINPVTHKLMHTALGAAEGAIVDGKNGAIAGAMGAGFAEVIAEVTAPKPPTLESMIELEAQYGRPLTHDEFAHEWNKQAVRYLNESNSVADASKILATAAALLANQDVDIAYTTAAKAVDNNFLSLIPGMIAGASYLYVAYQIHQTYENEGVEAALKHLGIEVVQNAACIGAFKLGGKIYPSAKAAIKTALDENPAIKSALGSTAESLISAGKKLTKGVSNQVENIGKHINPSFAEDLVENVIPGSVANQVEKQVAKNAAKKGAEQLALPVPAKLPLLPASEKLPLLPAPVAREVAEEGLGKIKSFPPFNKKLKRHIFSDDHQRKGIMDLGPTKEAINDKFIEIIKKADAKNLLKEGPNNIVTEINGKTVTIRAFIKDGHVINYNGFTKLSNRKVDNKIFL